MHKYFSDRGLNLLAVFNIENLPPELNHALRKQCRTEEFTQLILLAHGGTKLWQRLQPLKPDSTDPIDEYSQQVTKEYFSKFCPGKQYQFLYPGDCKIDLQQLGSLAGWHHTSPFMLGINQTWGSWFAYRILLLANTQLTPTENISLGDPCANCHTKPCISACAGLAIQHNRFDLNSCVNYRMQTNSQCKQQCLARTSCPVGQEHRYSEEQMQYHYSISLQAIEHYFRSGSTLDSQTD